MHIRCGYDIIHDCPAPTPMLLMLSLRPERMSDLTAPHLITFDPPVTTSTYHDGFGNICTRLLAPRGLMRFHADFVVTDAGEPDEIVTDAVQHPVDELPEEVLIFLLGSRYCETDQLMEVAWRLFGHIPPGPARAWAIVDYVHDRIKFGYQYARATRTAWETFNEQVGVCRDFAHLAVALFRCMNIPARYCTGYLPDIGVPPFLPMDFSAWFEAWLGGRWRTFDARHDAPRIGRVMMALGRDATDTALSTCFGPTTLSRFDVIAEEVAG